MKPNNNHFKPITLVTSDKLRIIGHHYLVPVPSPGISLFHMMPATKESYHTFAGKLQFSGMGVLAIDLRGHGESTGGPESYKQFTDQQHQNSIYDVRVAIDFQKQEGHLPLYVCGASIGANLSLQIISQDKLVKKAILLSPGINYRGIDALPLTKKVTKEKEVYIVAAKDDVRGLGPADKQAEKIFKALNCKKKIKIFETGGHGTDILTAHPEFMKELVKWLKL